MDWEGAGNDFETDPEAGHDFEIFNCQLISSLFQFVSLCCEIGYDVSI